MFNNILSILKPKESQRYIKILVIEDSCVDQRMVSSVIERGGYTALVANNGKEGFEAAKLQKPQLIILDYNLPDILGPEVCKLLKAHSDTSYIPVLYLTSMTGPENVISCFEQGENYLAKPVSPKILLNQIEHILKNIKG